jgi:hypothetical protein
VECASAAFNDEGKVRSQFEALLVWDNSDESIIFGNSFLRKVGFGNRQILIYINVTSDILTMCL